LLNDIDRSLDLLSVKEKRILYFYAFSRSALGVLDVAGILLVGVLVGKIGSQASSSTGSSTQVSAFLPDFDLSIASLAIIILFTFLLKSILSIAFTRLMTLHLFRIEARLSKDIFRKVLFSESAELDRWSRSELGFALTYGAGYATTTTLAFSIIVLSESLLLVGITIAFAFINFGMTVGMIVYFAILGVLIQKFVGSRFKFAGSNFADSAMKSDTFVQDSVSAFREISTLGRQEFFVDRFASERTELARSTATITYLGTLPRYIIESALMVGIALIAFASVSSGNIEAAAVTLGVFISGGLRIMASMLPLQGALGAIKQQASQANIFFDLFASVNSTKTIEKQLESKSSLHANKVPAGVSLNNLNFTYAGASSPAIKNVSLSVKPGQMAALIGPSGSGKSTLADLILGLAKPSSGSVEIESGSVDNPENLEQMNIGYVPQSPGIITGTIAENIALGVMSEEIDFNQVENAIALANLSSTVNELPLGLNTHLGPQSNSLSGGQLQRIGLARALYVNPSLLVLDEATSALDADSEAAVTSALSKIAEITTVIVIAHRMSTIQHADIIFVLDAGEIVASGTFLELMRSNDLVSRYVELSEIDPTS
jgi:ABC-type multidrug transport system fused ATPase/permease subunit